MRKLPASPCCFFLTTRAKWASRSTISRICIWCDIKFFINSRSSLSRVSYLTNCYKKVYIYKNCIPWMYQRWNLSGLPENFKMDSRYEIKQFQNNFNCLKLLNRYCASVLHAYCKKQRKKFQKNSRQFFSNTFYY